MLEGQQRRDLVHYRIEKAYKSFDEAKGVAKLKYWNLTGNRLYYTVFHMASALLLDKGFTAKTHAGVIHLVGEIIILLFMSLQIYDYYLNGVGKMGENFEKQYIFKLLPL